LIDFTAREIYNLTKSQQSRRLRKARFVKDMARDWAFPDTPRVADLRRRVRAAMKQPPTRWDCPPRIDHHHMSDPLPVRKARAIALKLSQMPPYLWDGQLFAGSLTLESPRLHAEWAFPDYLTEAERTAGAAKGLTVHSVFGHIVPDYPTLLSSGLRGIRARAEKKVTPARTADELAFLDSVIIAVDAVIDYAQRLAEHCDKEAGRHRDAARAAELRQMASNLRQVPAGPAESFWQALQSVWLLHMVFHATMNGNAVGRLDQYAWPYLKADLDAGHLNPGNASELVTLFCLKFNERAQTQAELRADSRPAEARPATRTRHYTSSQLGTSRDRLDATNHWLQNIIVGGLTPTCQDGTNPLTYLLLESYQRNQMTNPLITLRVHRESPQDLVARTCEVLKAGGGMPALFNDDAIVPALEEIGIATVDALDYTNDGCWEVIIPGRTDFVFQRLSLMLCLEWALNRGVTRLTGVQEGLDTGDPSAFSSFEQVWEVFVAQVDAMVGGVVDHVVETMNDRASVAPVPLLSALIDGAIESCRDLTAGGARYRTYGLLAESAAHAIDSLTAIKTVVFDEHRATMAELCEALDSDFRGWGPLRTKLRSAPKYGNDDERADSVGREVIAAFTEIAASHANAHRASLRFPCGVATFSWYIGIGEGLGASPDGRRAGEPVSSNFSPALGRDGAGIPAAILSYSKMLHQRLPAGGPLDLRLARPLVDGAEGTRRMAGLVKAFVETGGSMMTLTVVDTEELRAAQREPENYESLRVRMGGWCAYFTMLSREQQEHHIRRQEGRS
jgi:pyruvate-formate lyase